MATLMGVVSQVVGEVFAVAGDGTRRPLVEGDRVYAGEQLVTGAGGAVAISLANGNVLTLGRDSNLNLSEQMLAAGGERPGAPQTQEAVTPTDADLTDVERLQAAIAAEPQPIHVPRERPPVVVLDEGPLVLVETRRDLAAVKLPFDA